MAYRSADYVRLAKGGFLLGVCLLFGGFAAAQLGQAVYGSLPGWEQTLFVDMEIAGILVGLLSPFVFGIAAPLVT